jgi:glycosyltransferase 2 family protein
MSSRAKGILQFIILLSIGLAFIWFSLRKITTEEKTSIINAFKTADYSWVLLSMVISFFSHSIRAYRWNLLLEPTGHRVNLLNSNCYVFVGYLANYGIPRMGEVTRCSLATKYDKVPFQVALGTVITERIVDLLIFVLIFFLTLAVQFSKLKGLAEEYIFKGLREKFASGSSAVIILCAIVLVLAVAIFLSRKKIASLLTGKIGSIIKGMVEGLVSVGKLKRPLLFISLSLLIWCCYFYSLYTCLFAIPGTAGLGHRECLTLLLFGTIGVMFSPGGLGAYPAIVGGILAVTYAVDAVSAFAVPWLSWGSQFIVIVITGIISLIVLPIYNRNKNAVSPAA